MKTVKKALIIALAVIFSFSCNTVLALAIENVLREPTTISGIEEEISALSSSALTKTISITPCEGTRKVTLSLYDSASKKYNTVEEYTTADAHTSTLNITFPKEKRKKTSGTWKITVGNTLKAEKAEKTVLVTSENIVSKQLSAKAVCVYCIEDKKVIYEKQMHKRLKQASLTKIMTATLLLESGKLSKSKKISKKAANTPYSTPKLIAGDKFTNKALLNALLIRSSNGAAVAIGESVSKTSPKFVKKMNKKAAKLGLKDTHYANPHGLDAKKHYSSAYDTALLMSYIYPKNKTFRSVIAKKSYKIQSKKIKPTRIYSTDKLKGYSSKHKGGKTGYTKGAGNCFCGVYVHGGKTYVVCVLGGKTSKSRWSDMKKLYSYIDNYASTKY